MVFWTESARKDHERLHGFLAAVDPRAAAKVAAALLNAVEQLAAVPRLGTRLNEFRIREVRRLIAGDYEIRYEVQGDRLLVLRLWHVREDR